MKTLMRVFFGFYFLYRITDTTTGALIERGESKQYPDEQECTNRQHAWLIWVTTPRLDPKTKKLLPPDSVEMTKCDPGRLDKMPR